MNVLSKIIYKLKSKFKRKPKKTTYFEITITKFNEELEQYIEYNFKDVIRYEFRPQKEIYMWLSDDTLIVSGYYSVEILPKEIIENYEC